jgi:hypothetical protein
MADPMHLEENQKHRVPTAAGQSAEFEKKMIWLRFG